MERLNLHKILEVYTKLLSPEPLETGLIVMSRPPTFYINVGYVDYYDDAD